MKKNALVLSCILVSVSFFSFADETNDLHIAMGAGLIDLQEDSQNTALSLVIEGQKLKSVWNIRPVLLAISGDDNSLYAGIGLLKELPLSTNWIFGFGFSAGRYDQGNSDRDLGYDIEFHSRIILDYKFNNQNFVRAELGHLSNAFLGDTNPGTELFTLNWVAAFK